MRAAFRIINIYTAAYAGVKGEGWSYKVNSYSDILISFIEIARSDKAERSIIIDNNLTGFVFSFLILIGISQLFRQTVAILCLEHCGHLIIANRFYAAAVAYHFQNKLPNGSRFFFAVVITFCGNLSRINSFITGTDILIGTCACAGIGVGAAVGIHGAGCGCNDPLVIHCVDYNVTAGSDLIIQSFSTKRLDFFIRQKILNRCFGGAVDNRHSDTAGDAYTGGTGTGNGLGTDDMAFAGIVFLRFKLDIQR